MEKSKLRSYPDMKASGIEWLGQIPVHWSVYSIRRRLSRADSIKIGPFGSQLKLEYMVPEGFKVYGQENVLAADFQRGVRYLDELRFAELRACEIVPGDLVITMMGTSGRCAVVPEGIERGIMDSHLLRIRLPDCDLDPGYLCLLIDESDYVKAQIGAAGKGAIMHGLNSSIVKDVVLAVPPLADQVNILAFLDRETARIDALVAKKERLIELLQEKRTALITHGVTKGLDPDAPMKDSGVEWLGQIPAHWNLKRLKYALASRKSALKTGPFGSQLQSSDMADTAIKVYNQRNVLDRNISTGENYISSSKFDELRAFEVFDDDLLVTTRGTIGRCMIVPPGSEKGILHPCLMRIQCDQSAILNRYLELLIQDSNQVISELQFMSNATTIDVIYSDSLREVHLAIPPIAEQQAIIGFLDRETAKIDTLIAKVGEASGRLKEYRTALISAVVTGKIDVRECIPDAKS